MFRELILTFISLSFATSAYAQQPRLRITFRADSAVYEPAAEAYRRLWQSDGARITDALERLSGLHFDENDIVAIVFEGASSSGFRDIPMRMRASYGEDTRKATLIHELGHRLQGRFFRQSDEDHPWLFLYLYDVWVNLYGQAFADAQVAVESRRRGIYDYESAWKTALAMSASERAAKWNQFLREHGVPPGW